MPYRFHQLYNTVKSLICYSKHTKSMVSVQRFKVQGSVVQGSEDQGSGFEGSGFGWHILKSFHSRAFSIQNSRINGSDLGEP